MDRFAIVIMALGIAAVYIFSIAVRSSLIRAWQWQFDDLKHRINQIDLMVGKVYSNTENGWYIEYDNSKKRRKRKPRRRNRQRTKPTDYTYTEDDKKAIREMRTGGEPGLTNPCSEIPVSPTATTTLFIEHSQLCLHMKAHPDYNTGKYDDCPDPNCPWAK